MYNHDYLVTHDLDCFFVMNGAKTHIATNGGIVHPKIGTVEELRAMQTQVANMEGTHDFFLNSGYLSLLEASDFPSQEDLMRLDLDNRQLFERELFEGTEYAELPFHQKLYCSSFVEMARKGFWSLDRVGIMPDGTDAYMLIAWPKGENDSDGIEVGHSFSLAGFNDYGCHCEFSNCWPVMEMIRKAERL